MKKISFLFKRPLKNNLLELVILFLAITLGFLAENYREIYVEKQRSKKLLFSLYIDLKGDLEQFAAFTKTREQLFENVYLFIDDVEARGLLKKDLKQQKLFAKAIFSWVYFEPNTANIDQIISSGALRYIGDDEIIHQIGVIQSQSTAIMDRQEREQEYFLNYLQPLMHQYYNFKWVNTNFVRKWDSYVNAMAKIESINTKEADYMFWENNPDLQQKIINLFENYLFIIRGSYNSNFDDYINEINDMILLIENKLSIE